MRGGLRDAHERRVLVSREVEFKNAGLRKFVGEQKNVKANELSEKRVEVCRVGRRIAAEVEEVEQNDRRIFSLIESEKREKVRALEERIANELEAVKREDARDEFEKKKVVEGSEELKLLKEKFARARVTKERAAQLYDQQNRAELEEEEELRMATEMEHTRLKQLESEIRSRDVEERKRRDVKLGQEEQLAEARRLEGIAAMEQFTREKAQVDEIVGRIRNEDEQERQMREMCRVAGRKALEEYQRAKEDYKIRESEAARIEEKKIAEYDRLRREREDAVIREREMAQEERRRILNDLSRQQLTRQSDRDELECLRGELYREELEATEREKEAKQLQKAIESRVEMLRAYETQMAEKELRRKADGNAEREFVEEMMAKFALDDKIELMNDQKRRIKLLDHRKDFGDTI
eukprot:TRINITY_DN68319_c0_g2_i1.p1 TRINITY_DN68319_c0_g2~~TRINITY_DN68319_c0_g2_i1.p1  ORF type:complete len:409 (-),score=77.33 TRINITY_DN68319_c0_g2_i1:1-1227(-)